MADTHNAATAEQTAATTGTPPASSPVAAPAAEDVPASTGSSDEDEPGLLPPQHWVQLAAEGGRDDSDADSAVGSDVASSTESVTSSILHYRTILGRTYHSDVGNAQYWGSNDEVQNDALDIQHHVLTLSAGGKLYHAPLPDNMQDVLDIGTGTGIWAIDFADSHPDTQVVGTDISPIQPTWVPPNLKFEIEDCTQEWTFPPNKFDFIQLRWLIGSVKDWTALFREAYKCCKPGGYVESNEGNPVIETDDGDLDPTSAMGQWSSFFVEGERRMGQSFSIVTQGVQRKAMEEAGFVDVHEEEHKIPIGSWPKDKRLKEVGQFSQLLLERDADGIINYLAGVIQGWSKEEISVYIAYFRRQMRSQTHHAYYRQKIVWGRKPTA
ncbi:Methyltransferase domain-containing protein [Pleurostoma richardsiae]|uniref:Methyltransferase domain-containing protein n=1 Tax=Pleurostoma richardsiae TaxID=41990 RepID=A0AA38RRJ6_9PEZI|nr:Methyltransferase domain-containing protein [Pleurostoma richardsiae]